MQALKSQSLLSLNAGDPLTLDVTELQAHLRAESNVGLERLSALITTTQRLWADLSVVIDETRPFGPPARVPAPPSSPIRRDTTTSSIQAVHTPRIRQMMLHAPKPTSATSHGLADASPVSQSRAETAAMRDFFAQRFSRAILSTFENAFTALATFFSPVSSSNIHIQVLLSSIENEASLDKICLGVSHASESALSLISNAFEHVVKLPTISRLPLSLASCRPFIRKVEAGTLALVQSIKSAVPGFVPSPVLQSLQKQFDVAPYLSSTQIDFGSLKRDAHEVLDQFELVSQMASHHQFAIDFYFLLMLSHMLLFAESALS